jgi:DNA-binding LacI/PurR family transcriptional regulator
VVNVSAIHLPGAPEFPRVNTDVADTAQMAADYFLERGFRNFAYLSLRGLEYAARQQHAFVAAVEKAGTQPPVAWQSARQFAGILPASHPLPPLVKNGVGKAQVGEVR